MTRKTIGILLLGAAIALAAAASIATRRPGRLWQTEAENGAIRALRALMWAEFAFGAKNGGFYDAPECLTAPASCLPGYTGEPFLRPDFDAAARRAGYQITYYPGPSAESWTGGTKASSPRGVQSFAFIARPPSNTWYGPRTICADSALRMCASTATFDASAGVCPAECHSGARQW